uniref:Cadherin-1 n=1 Tax=Neogobius melanostomus TaxID=47308 RepID=A0A8C6USH9_9GOBI
MHKNHSSCFVISVEFNDCSDRSRFIFNCEDTRFAVHTDGGVTVKRHVHLHDRHKTFAVHTWDSDGNKFTVLVTVRHQRHHHEHGHRGHHHGDGHQENHQGNHKDGDQSGHHQTEVNRSNVDFLPQSFDLLQHHGPRADQPPVGLFTMDRETGILYVTQPLDREAKSNYTFLAHAVAEGSGKAENPMEVKVIVIDMNDNKPIFTKDLYTAEVAESSPVGKYNSFMFVKATDADQEGTSNAAVHYRIMNQEPKSPADDMFTINPVNGFIRVNAKGLDREVRTYTLDVRAADMDGEGLTGFTKVILTVTDSNDNAPIYTETQKDAFVVKMSVTDKDDAHTPAWNAKFTIIDGNKDGLFTVETGASKQEGIITTAKGLDFEKISTHTLLVAVENEVPFAVELPTSTATITVTVLDVNEPPIFDPAVKVISKPEDLAVDQTVVRYTAHDPDTARKQTVKYKIVSDPAGWLNVDKDTGVVTVKAEMDREHLFVKNDVYTALIGAYDDDEVPATGTGTLEIKLEDVNDNAPTIQERDIRVCNKEPGSHLLTVTDRDGPGFSAPFTVMLEGSSKNNWTARMNETGQYSRQLYPGTYDVQLRVADTMNLDQLSTVTAQVCECKGPDVTCEGRIAGAHLLLVLLLLLFARRRGTEQKEPLLQEDDIRDNIYYYDEEGGGETTSITFDFSRVLHRGLDNRPDVMRDDVMPNYLTVPQYQYKPRPSNPDEIGNFIEDNMKAADNDPTAPPYDSLLVFDYEGGGSDAGSLSTINSSHSGTRTTTASASGARASRSSPTCTGAERTTT